MPHEFTNVKKLKLEEASGDFLYWQSQPYEKRLEALETIRTEYINWKYGVQQRFQRIYRVIKPQ
ncbi:MAG: hypothetical protein GY862_38130 [Gammaproteobacteria bacterium]|nr:hypothetical protein [Gammaproteobacteria bacterium]